MALKHKTFSRKQRILIGLNVLVMIGIALAIFMGVCHIAAMPQFRFRADLTKESAFSLSDVTLDRLSSLDKTVNVTYVTDNSVSMIDRFQMGAAEIKVMNFARELLQEYVIRSGGKIKLEILDKHADNLRVQELNDTIGLGSNRVIIFTCGKNRKDLYPSDLANIDAGGTDPTSNTYQFAKVKSYTAETSLTWALESVIEDKKPKAYFTTGRRESSIKSELPQDMLFAADFLKYSNYEVEELKLYEKPEVPEDCTVLVIAGPADDYSEEEAAAVIKYLRNRGKLFLALSPGSTTSLDGILEAFNIALDRSILCRETLASQDQLSIKSYIKTDGFSTRSRITRSIAEEKMFGGFYKAGSVKSAQDDTNVQRLVWAERCWADTHAPGQEGNYFLDSVNEKMGIYEIGVSCEGSGDYEGARLVFFADTYFYTNDRNNRQTPGNQLLVINSMNWLASRENLLDIPSKTPYISKVDLTLEESHQIGFYVVIIIPLMGLFAGLVVWWLRRR